MKDIQRYEIAGLGQDHYAMMPAEDGDSVKYEDHAGIVAQLQEQVKELAAENASLKDREKRLLKNIHEDLQDADFHLAQLKTPATDAFIAEIKSQGVEAFIGLIQHLEGMLYAESLKSTAQEFAAQLRAAPDAEEGV